MTTTYRPISNADVIALLWLSGFQPEKFLEALPKHAVLFEDSPELVSFLKRSTHTVKVPWKQYNKLRRLLVDAFRGNMPRDLSLIQQMAELTPFA